MSYSVRASGKGTLHHRNARSRKDAWEDVKAAKDRGLFHTIRVFLDGKQVWMTVNTGERWVDD